MTISNNALRVSFNCDGISTVFRYEVKAMVTAAPVSGNLTASCQKGKRSPA